MRVGGRKNRIANLPGEARRSFGRNEKAGGWRIVGRGEVLARGGGSLPRGGEERVKRGGGKEDGAFRPRLFRRRASSGTHLASYLFSVFQFCL